VIHPQERVGVKHPDVVESDLGWAVRLASGGDENHLAAQLAYAKRAGKGYGVSVFERGPTADKFDAMQFEILQDAPPLHFHHFALVVHEIVDGKIFFEGIVDTVETTLLETGKVECGDRKS